MNRRPKPVNLMNDVELVECLASYIGLTFQDIKKLFKEEIDGQAFLLMEKKDLSYLGLLDKYSQICLHFPYGKFVDGFI